MVETTTIRISKVTYDRLRQQGKFGDTYNSILNRLMDEYEQVSEPTEEYRSQSKNETGDTHEGAGTC